MIKSKEPLPKMSRIKKWLKFSLIIILVAYAISIVLLYFFQEKLLFNPYKIDKNHYYKTAKEIEIPTKDGININTLLLTPQDNDEDVVLYLHGNRGNNNFGLYQTRPILPFAGNIYIPDYRSYGKTEGSLSSDSQMNTDMENVLLHITKKHSFENITVVGFSMGSGMAAALAKKYPIKQLVLVAPYTSLSDLKDHYIPIVPDFIMKYDFPVKEYLKSVKCPIYLIHGKEDEVIPFENSEKLNSLFPSKTKLYISDRSGHRRIIFSEAVRKCYTEILN